MTTDWSFLDDDGEEVPTAQYTTAPDLALASDFWMAYAPNEPVRLRFIPDKNKHQGGVHESVYPDMATAWPEVLREQAAGFGVFFVVNAVAPDVKTASDHKVTGIRSFVADFDEGLPADLHLRPSFVINTSTKDGVERVQALWRITGEADPREYADQQRRIVAYYATADRSCVNRSRVFRLPGSVHQKRQPQLVTVEHVHTDLYTAEQVFAGIPALPPRAKHEGGAGFPVSEEVLVERLSWIDPLCPVAGQEHGTRAKWVKVVLAIASTRLIGSAVPADRATFDEEGTLLSIAQAWSRGEYDRQHRYDSGPPATWGVNSEGEAEDTDAVIEGMFADNNPERDEVVTFGTINHFAKEAGRPSAEQVEQAKAEKRKARFTIEWPHEFVNKPELEYWDQDRMVPRYPDGGIGLIHAAWGQLKTAVVLRILLDAVIKKDAKIIYAAGEGSYGVGKSRIPAYARDLGYRLEDLKGRFGIVSAVPLLQDRPNVDAFIASVREQEFMPDVVAIDTLATATAGLDENGSEMASQLTSNGGAGRIREAFNALVWLVAHDGKNSDRGIRGNSGIAGNADFSMQVFADKKRGLIKVILDKMRDGPDRLASYWQFTTSKTEVPVPTPISRDDYRGMGGDDRKGGDDGEEDEEDEIAEMTRKGLRQQIRELIESKKWKTWDDGKTDAEVAKILIGKEEPSEPKARRTWMDEVRKLTRLLGKCHGTEDKVVRAARIMGSWQHEGKFMPNDDSAKSLKARWHWHDSGRYPAGVAE